MKTPFLDEFISELSPSQQVVVDALYIKGNTVHVAAARLGKTVRELRSLRDEALAELRSKLEG